MRYSGYPMSRDRTENWIEQSKRMGLLIRRSIKRGFVWGTGIPANQGVDLINPITKCAARKAARRIALFIIRSIRADPHRSATKQQIKTLDAFPFRPRYAKWAKDGKIGWVFFLFGDEKIWNVALAFVFLRAVSSF